MFSFFYYKLKNQYFPFELKTKKQIIIEKYLKMMR
jgi:hypothetical protein